MNPALDVVPFLVIPNEQEFLLAGRALDNVLMVVI
jgi:hypothetical protein